MTGKSGFQSYNIEWWSPPSSNQRPQFMQRRARGDRVHGSCSTRPKNVCARLSFLPIDAREHFKKLPAACQNGETVPWRRCEKWARQVVEPVAGIRSTGNIIGTLGLFRAATPLLDTEDNVVLLYQARYRMSVEIDNGLIVYYTAEEK